MKTALQQTELAIAAGNVSLPGTLRMPANPKGIVIFAHGSGSGRLSPRNQAVGQSLIDRGAGTFLFDLLSPGETEDRRNVFDIGLLSGRMLRATERVLGVDEAAKWPIGYFGASTGAAAALVAAAELGRQIAAVVSRGGRPDLAGEHLPAVTAPTLLLVGSLDHQVLDLNRQAQSRMRCETRLEVIQDATHLFEEPGTLKEVARLAGEWFIDKFAQAAPAA